METRPENSELTSGEPGKSRGRSCADNPLLRRRVLGSMSGGQGKISPVVLLIIGTLVGGFWLANRMLNNTGRGSGDSVGMAVEGTPGGLESIFPRLTVEVDIESTANVIGAPVAALDVLVGASAGALPARVARRDGGGAGAGCVVYCRVGECETLGELNPDCEVVLQ